MSTACPVVDGKPFLKAVLSKCFAYPRLYASEDLLLKTIRRMTGINYRPGLHNANRMDNNKNLQTIEKKTLPPCAFEEKIACNTLTYF